ncbi:MAG: glycosyltransferase [Sedimentisphaerales bacterium]|nr:glycosyltransferase [Sedimentisphaerales bacterium]
MVEAWRHFSFYLRKYQRNSTKYLPRTALICPCKGLDTTFDKNIDSLFHQEYPDYEIFFVVESPDDPAYERLKNTISAKSSNSDCPQAHLIIAGPAQTCAQKVYNLLTVYKSLSDDIEVMAFIDSDACLKPNFLSGLVYPLKRDRVGAATGYRWFVPTDYRFSSIVLSAMNAFFASQLGPHPWNCVWGGAMALRHEVFDRIGLDKVWRNTCTDDYSLTRTVRQAGLSIAFVPGCFVASYESTNWSDLYWFARRQFIITRVCVPKLWMLAVLGVGHFVLAFWLGMGVSMYLYMNNLSYAGYAAILPGVLYLSSVIKGVFRQFAIRKILPDDRKRLLIPGLVDIFLQPVVGLFTLTCLLSASFSRVIDWRGIRYILHDYEHTEVILKTGPTEKCDN